MTNPTPRGIRNNNPGNIDRNATRWQGMSNDQSGDPRFIVFTSPVYGIRAIGKILQTYATKYQLVTPAGIIGRWAPPTENDTKAYVASVAQKLGVRPTDTVDVRNAATMEVFVRAIIQHENGQQPYSDDTIRQGVALALAP